MEANVYYGYVRGHRQRQGDLGKPRVDTTRLSWAMLGVERSRDRGTKSRSQEAKGQTGKVNQDVWLI